MSKIDDKIANGYQLNLSQLYFDTINIYKKSALVSGLILFLLGIVVFVLYAVGLFIYFETPLPTEEQIQSFNIYNLSTQQLLTFVLLQAFIFGVFGVLSAGLLRLCENVDENRPPMLETIFQVFVQKTGWSVFIFAFIFQLILSFITFFFDTLNVFLASWFIMILAYTLFIFVIPLLIFEKQSLGKSVVNSTKIVNKRPVLMLSLVMFNSVFAMAGLFFFLIGIFATLPIWYAFVYSLYKQFKQ